MNKGSTKRPGSSANISPTMNRSKAMKEIQDFQLPAELSSDPRVPEYAKTLISQMSSLLKFVSTLLTDQTTPQEAIEEDRRQRSVIIKNLPESKNSSAVGRARSDGQKVEQIMDAYGIESVPATTLRLGKPVEGRPRPLLVTMHHRAVARNLLTNRGKAKNIMFPTVQIHESLSREELKNREELVKERIEKNAALSNEEKGQNPWILYANVLMRRADVESHKSRLREEKMD
jgi:hypothetical protein